jgi:hypothetical protein
MNPINLQLTFIDETTETVSCIAADLIEFEEHFDLSVSRLEKDYKFTHLAFLGFAALTRLGKTSEDFVTWRKKLAGISDLSVKK